ncbi:hypothetical protein HF086_012041 [Spodoptera exigua]|uniref:Uncharacterized protein n=1 Tax=Spodoptera exigua TaxID=7107 RepID=A0A922SHS9_SPOEX|nr:hypothetical protein HF086_012041 [Spodoptera exigua]
MRTSIIIAVLAALTACHDAATPQSLEERFPGYKLVYDVEDVAQNRITLSNGEVRHDEVLLYEEEIYKPAIPGVVQTVVVSHRAKPGTWISRSSLSIYPLPSYIHTYRLIPHMILIRISSQVGQGLVGTIRVFGILDYYDKN